MHGWRGGVSAARAKVPPRRNQDRHALVLRLPQHTNDAAAPRTYLRISRSACAGAPACSEKNSFFRKLLKGLRYVPRVIITDKLKTYGAAKREILPGVEHRQSRYLNSRCENSHRPTRQRERRMQGFKSAGHASASCLPRVLSPNTSDPDGICYQRLTTGKRCGNDSRAGLPSRARSELPKGQRRAE